MNIRILIFCMLIPAFVSANSKKQINDSLPYAVVIKLSLLPVFELYPALQVGVEHSFMKRFSVAHEFGFIADELSIWRIVQPKIKVDRIGLRYRLMPRYYFGDIQPHDENFFIGPDIMYKYVLLRQQEEYCRYGCSYVQNLSVRQHRHVIGLGVKTGVVQGFAKTGFIIEFEIGLGGKLQLTTDNIPNDATQNLTDRIGMFGNIFGLNEKKPKTRFLFNSVISFKLGWGIPAKYRNTGNALPFSE